MFTIRKKLIATLVSFRTVVCLFRLLDAIPIAYAIMHDYIPRIKNFMKKFKSKLFSRLCTSYEYNLSSNLSLSSNHKDLEYYITIILQFYIKRQYIEIQF